MYLNVHSYYSLRYGTLSIAQLLSQARDCGVTAMALTDIGNTTGCLEFVRACREAGILPIPGLECRRGDRLLYIMIAQDGHGFARMNEWLSYYHLSGQDLPDSAPQLEGVASIYPQGSKDPAELGEQDWIAIRSSGLNRLRMHPEPALLSRMVIWHPVTFCGPGGYMLHRHLRAIDRNILLSRLEERYLAAADEYMIPQGELLDRFAGFPAIISNTERLIGCCAFDFDFSLSRNKAYFTSGRYDDRELLEKLAWDGLNYRYGVENQEAVMRVRHELEIIDRLGFSAYFLIAWDIIRYSMSRGFYHVGRGSGANSIVAYCLRITDVDPIELDLYFERFLNPRRTSPPDFDIDYSWKERDEVLEYIFKRYGHRHTALLGTITTFRESAVIRELGKVYGLPKEEIDALVEQEPPPSGRDGIVSRVFHYGSQLMDFPNHRSIHSGGVLISEQPIFYYSALDLPPKGFPTVQWDMYLAENIGLDKLDILSQRGIGHIKDAAVLILKNRRVEVDVHDIPAFKRDEQVARQLRSGDTIGCFYIESPAMRGLLKKLSCDDYLTLVAASSIIRPGVARSGMMREYIYRFHHPEGFDYIHPVMREQLQETFGVMVYQEDVIRICHHFAGLDLAEADVLRRIMSGKNRDGGKFEQIRERFFDNCRQRAYPEAVSREVWRQIESFAGYSFSKAHSASYAVESYQSLFLKAHYPIEFMVAVINNFGGFYPTWVYVNEAMNCGGRICLPCVNRSGYATGIEGLDIYLGFVHIAHLEERTVRCLLAEREARGPYRDFPDFVERCAPSLDQVLVLIRINAFRFTGLSKKSLLWEAYLLLGGRQGAPIPGPVLFREAPRSYTLPALTDSLLEDAYDEMEILGFPVSLSAFDMLETSFRGELFAADLRDQVGKRVRMAGNFVAAKYVRTVKGEVMYFGTFLDARGRFFDTTHFPDSLAHSPLQGKGVYLILGKVVEEFGFPSLEVERAAKLPILPDPRFG